MRVVHCLAALIVGLFVWSAEAAGAIVVRVDKSTQTMRVIVDGEHRYTWASPPAAPATTRPSAPMRRSGWSGTGAPANTAWRRCPIPSSSAAATPSTAPTWSAVSAAWTATAASASRPAMPAPSSRWWRASVGRPASSSRAPRPARRRRLRLRAAPPAAPPPRPAPRRCALPSRRSARRGSARRCRGRSRAAPIRPPSASPPARRPRHGPAGASDSRYFTEWFLRR